MASLRNRYSEQQKQQYQFLPQNIDDEKHHHHRNNRGRFNRYKSCCWTHPTSKIIMLFTENIITKHQKSIIFGLFMLLWIIYGILNQYNSINHISFDATTVVWSQEFLKIILSLLLFFLQDGGPVILYREVKQHAFTMLVWYLIPAGLYALGDVLTYINLRSFDPATLHLLGEMKLVVTAIVHQCLFKRMLNRWHWMALLIITSGCLLKAMDSLEMTTSDDTTTTTNRNDGGDTAEGSSSKEGSDESTTNAQSTTTIMPHPTILNFGLIAIHIFITTVAGVFNEKLLKDKPSICINLQNLCLYLNGMVFLTLGMVAGISEHHGTSIKEALSYTSLHALFSQPSILAMAIVMSIAGIVTSRFLKVFDSIRKSVAVALVVVSLPLLSRLIFGTPITVKMIISILMVVAGMQIYTLQPPPRQLVESTDGDDGEEQMIMVDVTREDDESELFLSAIALPGDKDVVDHAQHTSCSREYDSVPMQELPAVKAPSGILDAIA